MPSVGPLLVSGRLLPPTLSSLLSSTGSKGTGLKGLQTLTRQDVGARVVEEACPCAGPPSAGSMGLVGAEICHTWVGARAV